jgi:hypothetical protein
MNDDSLSPVFNLRGCVFKNINESNERGGISYMVKDKDGKFIVNYLERDSFLTGAGFKENDNSYGVFKNPGETQDHQIIGDTEIKPWYYNIKIPD